MSPSPLAGTADSGAAGPPSAASIILHALRSPAFRVLTLVNLVLIAIHVVVAISPDEESRPWSSFLRIDHDRSLGEWFESAQLLYVLVLIARPRRQIRAARGLLGLVFAFMLVDNLVEIRESASLWIAPGRRHLMELLLVVALAPLLAIAAIGACRRSPRVERPRLVALSVAFAAFALFAVLIDYLNEFVRDYGPHASAIARVVEDGGELLTLSLLVVVAARILTEPPGLPAAARTGIAQ